MNTDIHIGDYKGVMYYDLTITASDVENAVAQYAHNTKPPMRNENLPQGLPPIVMAFYQLVVVDDALPSLARLTAYFHRLNKVSLSKEEKARVDGRIYTAYPSLVRDLHFLLLLQEEGLNARYSMQSDLNGVDIWIRDGNQEFGLAIFRNTTRAQEYREKKKNKTDVDLIEVVSEVNTSTNKITLLCREQAESVKELISKRRLFGVLGPVERCNG
jgi:hypothetical protein